MEAAQLAWRPAEGGSWSADLPDGRVLRVWVTGRSGLRLKIRWEPGKGHVPDVEYRARIWDPIDKDETDLGTYPTKEAAQAQAGHWALNHLRARASV